MLKPLVLLLAAAAVAWPISASAQAPIIVSPDGTYLGTLSSNRYDPDSVSNPYGRYGSRYSPESINNPYGQYGSRYSPDSASNPYATSRLSSSAPVSGLVARGG